MSIIGVGISSGFSRRHSRTNISCSVNSRATTICCLTLGSVYIPGRTHEVRLSVSAAKRTTVFAQSVSLILSAVNLVQVTSPNISCFWSSLLVVMFISQIMAKSYIELSALVSTDSGITSLNFGTNCAKKNWRSAIIFCIQHVKEFSIFSFKFSVYKYLQATLNCCVSSVQNWWHLLGSIWWKWNVR